MKKLQWLLLLACCLVVACESRPDVPPSATTSRPWETLPEDFFMKLQGDIGDSAHITMALNCSGSSLYGDFYEDGHQNAPIGFQGEAWKQNRLRMHSTSSGQGVFVEFWGEFDSTGVFIGYMRDLISEKEYPVRLTETKEGTAGITMVALSRENCAHRNLNLQKPLPEIEHYTDTLCTKVYLGFPQITLTDAAIAAKVNQKIGQIILHTNRHSYSTLVDYLSLVDTVPETHYLHESVGMDLLMNDHDILSLSMRDYKLEGRAEPKFADWNYSFDLRTGRLLSLSDVLLPGYETGLRELPKHKSLWIHGPLASPLEDSKFQPNDNFLISPHGLVFNYGWDENGKCPDFGPSIIILYADLKPWIKADGPLMRMVQP